MGVRSTLTERSLNVNNGDILGLTEAGAQLVDGDRSAASWRQKLEVVDGLVGRGGNQSSDALAFSAIYCNWIGSGAIRCAEGGGHHRPCRHAELAKSIFYNVENKLVSGAEQDQVSVPSMFPQRSLSVPSVFPQCSLSVPSVFPQCSLSVLSMFPQCSLSVPSVFPQCSLNVPSVFPQCSLSVPSVFP
jgi:hypothetical protein